MNKLVLVSFTTVIACAFAASLSDVQILKQENDNIGLGNYRFYYEQSDETRHEQTGTLRNAGSENPIQEVSGFYTWRAPNGVLYLVKYIANENGYQPEVEEGPGALPPAATASLLG